METAQRQVHLIAATVGFLSFFLIWLAIVWGLILRNGWASTRIRHSTAYGIHQTVALLGLCRAPSCTPWPNWPTRSGRSGSSTSSCRSSARSNPIGIGVGVIGLEVMVAAALSIIIQRRLGFSRWRALHAMTYVAFMLVVRTRADLRHRHRPTAGVGIGDDSLADHRRAVRRPPHRGCAASGAARSTG